MLVTGFSTQFLLNGSALDYPTVLMLCVGINIGSLTMKVASLEGEQVRFRVANHGGRPIRLIERLVQEYPPGTFFGVCGHLGHISEVAATEAALQYVGGISMRWRRWAGRVSRSTCSKAAGFLTVLSHNQCAAGSGEFLIQQIGRLGLSLEEAMRSSFEGNVVPRRHGAASTASRTSRTS